MLHVFIRSVTHLYGCLFIGPLALPCSEVQQNCLVQGMQPQPSSSSPLRWFFFGLKILYCNNLGLLFCFWQCVFLRDGMNFGKRDSPCFLQALVSSLIGSTFAQSASSWEGGRVGVGGRGLYKLFNRPHKHIAQWLHGVDFQKWYKSV